MRNETRAGLMTEGSTGELYPSAAKAMLNGLGAQNAVGGFGEAWAGSIGSVSPIVWMTDALQGQ